MTAQARGVRYSARRYWLPVLAFYAASLVVPFLLSQGRDLLVASCVLAFATGAAVVVGTHWCNLWMLLTIGFSQFAVLTLPAAVQNPALVEETFALRVPVQIAAVCAAGGVLAQLIRRRALGPDVLSAGDFIRWLNPTGSPIDGTFDRIEFVQKIVTFVGSGWTVLRFVVSHW